MPLIITKDWFETIQKIWNSNPEYVKGMAEIQESILWISDDIPIARMPKDVKEAVLKSGLIDPEAWQRMERENRAEVIINIRNGVIELRFATPDDKPTATMRGTYESFEEMAMGKTDIVWQTLDGKIKFRGVLPRFTRNFDWYSKLMEIIVENTELP